MAKTNKIPLLYTSFLYVCGLILFLEWLYPVQVLADVKQLDIFIVYAIFCFLLSLLKLRWWAAVPLKLAGVVFIIHALYFDVPFFSQLWFDLMKAEITYNIQAIFAQSWYSITSFFRTVLFLLIIWIMSYLIHYWFFVMKRFFLFIFLTFVYVSVIDTFTLYDGKMAIIRVFIVSFLALGVANFIKEVNKESLSFSWMKRAPIWIVPIIMIVLFSSIVGFSTPKFEPQWPDPLPFVQGVVNPSKDSDDKKVVRKVGYGEDDSRLGGSFEQDDSVVFHAVTPKDHYWRVETKDVYTGKGWEQLEETDYVEQQADNISLTTFSNDVITEKLQTHITFEGNSKLDRLVYPYIPTSVEEMDTDHTQLLLDKSTEGIHTKSDGKKVKLSSYSITYEYPLYDLDTLQSVESKPDESDFYKRYTQLPESVPDRVHELAEEITEDYSNMHDQALAVEKYFQENDYVYQTDDVAIPEEDEDYVDQFLFDTQAGYCDNYSSSMVVLLRSLGIPTRWAKGFTSGTMVESDVSSDNNDETSDLYEITNANAHSWVEVYFPDVGWVPFEPTKGFSSNVEYVMDEMEETDDIVENEDEEAENEEDLEENEIDIPDPDNGSTSSDENSNGTISNWFNLNYVMVVIALIVITGGIIFYKTRHRWQTMMVSRRLKRKEDVASFEAAYLSLLRLLESRGVGKQPDQTLREYAQQIDEKFETTDMYLLTHAYEHVLYNDKESQKIDESLLNVWDDLVKRILT